VVRKIVSWYPDAKPVEEALAPFEELTESEDE
jgi:4-hydroxy-3-methylbut-2-enyl diphosphate reductase